MHVLAKLGSNFIILLLSLVADLWLNVCGRVSLLLSGLYAYVTVSECSKRMLVSPKLLRRRFSSLPPPVLFLTTHKDYVFRESG